MLLLHLMQSERQLELVMAVCHFMPINSLIVTLIQHHIIKFTMKLIIWRRST